MRISNVQPNINISYPQNNRKQNYIPGNNTVCNNKTNFTGAHFFVDNTLSLLYNPLRKLSNFSIEEYKSLSKTDLMLLRKRYSHISGFPNKKSGFYHNLEIMHDEASEELKNGLDAKYGQGKYVVLTVGRSVSSIGKVLGYKIGEDRVISLPLSFGSRYSEDFFIRKASENGGINVLNKFLAKAGLGKEKLIQNNQTCVLLDFCYSGDSLKGTENLFRNEAVYGDEVKLARENVMDFIPNKPFYRKHRYFNYFFENGFKSYSFVDKSNDLTGIDNAVRNPKQAGTEQRLVWFKLLDNEMTKRNARAQELTYNDGMFCAIAY